MISNLKSVEENQEYLKSIIKVDGRNRIKWKNCIGCKIEYEYNWKSEYLKGVLKIIKYEPKTHKVYFEGYKKGIATGDLTKCKLGGILGFITSEFKYEIDDTINYLTIIDRKYKKDKNGQNKKYYKYKCNKCENVDWIDEGSLKNGRGCNVCCQSPRKVVLGVNTIFLVTSRPTI